MRAGIHHGAYSHIESFRRQVFVIPPSEHFVLPSFTAIIYDDTLFRIFFSFDDMTRFLCKETGHTTNRCPSKSPTVTNTEQHSLNPENLSQNETPNEYMVPQLLPSQIVLQHHKELPENKPTETTKKRPARLNSKELPGKTRPISVSSDNDLTQTTEFVIPSAPNPRKQPKRLKTTSSTESLQAPQKSALTDHLAPLKVCFEKPNQFVPF